MQSYNRDELIKVFEKHSVYVVSAISLAVVLPISRDVDVY